MPRQIGDDLQVSRYHLYISHSFEHAGMHLKVRDFLKSEGVASADYSVPVWDLLPGDRAAVHAGIEERIRLSTHVIVVLTPGLHERYYVGFEIETAKKYGKKIIGMYPYGQNVAPIPQALDGYLYRAIGWRKQSLRKALDGDYPLETRTFDIAEVRDRLRIVHIVTASVAVVTVVVAGFTVASFRKLRAELRGHGVDIDLDGREWLARAMPPAVCGALLGAAIPALFRGNRRDMVIGAGVGALAGAAFGTRRYFKVKIQEAGEGLHSLQFKVAEGAP
jgi:hypothetical protein